MHASIYENFFFWFWSLFSGFSELFHFHVKKIQEFDVIHFYLNHLQFSNVSTDTTVILKEKMLNEKST